MAPKKPAKPNGFFMFAQNLKSKQGRKFNSMKEACDAAASIWHNMNQREKEVWNAMARETKERSDPGRYTSEGINVEFLTKEQKMEMDREEKMRQDIRQIMAVAQRKGSHGMAEETFFVIHVNIFCYHAQEEVYYPAEIAVLCFNLKNGVRPENIFHEFVKPGPLPFGYKFEAKQISDETHQIRIAFDDADENNMLDVFQNLITFLEKKKPGGTKRMPILYADEKNVKMIRQILNLWCMEFTENEESLFRVYSLPMMYMFLKNTVAGEEAYPTITIPQRELEKDVYAYNPDIACTYHSSTSRPQYCSKSAVSRYAFIICDSCCENVGIPLEPGFHVPMQSEIPDTASVRSSSSTSFVSNSSHSAKGGERRRRNERDFDTESTSNETWDTQSLISDSTTTATTMNTTADEFPALPSSGDRMLARNTSSGTSYAGATGGASFNSTSGPTLPAGFSSAFKSMSVDKAHSQTAGRGFRPRGKMSDDSGSDAPPSDYASSSDNDFPPIGVGRGRGFLAKKALTRPGVPQQ